MKCQSECNWKVISFIYVYYIYIYISVSCTYVHKFNQMVIKLHHDAHTASIVFAQNILFIQNRYIDFLVLLHSCHSNPLCLSFFRET